MTNSKPNLRLWSLLSWVVLSAFLAIGAWWLLRLPTVGKGGVFLAMGAVLMPLFWEKIGTAGRMFWIGMLSVLLTVEYRAIDKDQREKAEAQKKEVEAIGNGFTNVLADQQKEFADLIDQDREQFTAILTQENVQFAATMSRSEKIMGGLKEAVSAATGGDGFCYVMLVPRDDTDNTGTISSIIPRGKYPLTNVNALVTDDDMMVQYLNDVNNTGKTHSADDLANIVQRAQEWVHIGDLPPNFPEQFSLRATAARVQDRRMLTIRFWANNGAWTEKLALRRVNGRWLRLIRVWRERLDKKKRAMVADMILEQVDNGFPEDTNTKASSGLSAKPE